MSRSRIRVTGTVQGVGFRPFVYRHAVALGLSGYVLNDAAGVLIDVEGDPASIAVLERLLVDGPPPLARVATVSTEPAEPRGADGPFRIVASEAGGRQDVAVSVDSAACDACLAEVDDPSDRRYGYPFTNCTDCGPRYTIVRSVPYDRAATTMVEFVMCARCQAEYDDPGDRRFHAQPNACPRCGPRLAWRETGGEQTVAGAAALMAATSALRDGAVVAVKGIGGYHLAVDATNRGAVAELRRRKARDDKPFAVMVPDVTTATALCDLGPDGLAALASPRRPIVLAPRRAGAAVADLVAPGLPELGLLLPYSPLHHLLLSGLARPLVMTSGNLSDEPIAHEDVDAATRLRPLVDGLLGHDRPIHVRCDDSVMRAGPRRLQVLRRSRGYAPEPLELPFVAERAVLAVGAELKSTISVARRDLVIPSHHLGDLEHLATYEAFLQAVEHLPVLYGITPEIVAHDLHPEYLSTKFALDLDLPAVAVQHHHAHVASCMVEHGRTAPLLGVAFDGLGFGTDGTLWGGELLVAGFTGFTRVGHLRPITMPGGVSAIREPWRMAAAWLVSAVGRGAAVAALDDVEPTSRAAVLDLVERRQGLVTSSMGRLFDAVAVLVGGRRRVSYEAQAAIELEALARTVERVTAPRYDGLVLVTEGDGVSVLDPSPLIAHVVRERASGVPAAVIAAGFHEAIGRAAAALAAALARAHRLDAVALTGGVFQNARLTEIVEDELAGAGLTVLVHAAVPPNDGGISVGQAAIAAFPGGAAPRPAPSPS